MFNRKRIRSLLLSSVAILFLTVAGYAQDSQKSESSAKTEAQEITEKAVLNGCAVAIERIKAGDAHIANLEAENQTQSLTLAAWKTKVTVLEQTISVNQKEIAALRDAIALKDSAMVALQKQLDITIAEVDRQKKRGNTKFKIGFVTGFIGGIALRFLF